ncbi:hypothetical protein A3C23_02390 [Candidatus Roizmanbacteria bacterium RIFCSPHIGHO2_02_FULL_37_13b]|uniref:LysM domain-containing protein n=1 Tax=Candidatus Roizmanbacteria bacterium RIFCSPLOWO2_02_FULL_36_11 TaxID=1802071 RepID=A0A1F7JIN5_9BACT|nr:MAG: hypothetical protein A3C23_02390 [Candidatus Roizmanbacteria bacterium RIFCSPHIGHO2_02_FULL_37_13b]OGK55484.1 MAG: hypothetical protein A3H78_04935 [Candidatus Roizmanbacteria bacterium RIFCSPLOWO2_02_FULL_36_11]
MSRPDRGPHEAPYEATTNWGRVGCVGVIGLAAIVAAGGLFIASLGRGGSPVGPTSSPDGGQTPIGAACVPVGSDGLLAAKVRLGVMPARLEYPGGGVIDFCNVGDMRSYNNVPKGARLCRSTRDCTGSAPKAPKGCDDSVTVQKGDTPYGLAQSQGTTLDGLADCNPTISERIKDGDIRAGEVLNAP